MDGISARLMAGDLEREFSAAGTAHVAHWRRKPHRKLAEVARSCPLTFVFLVPRRCIAVRARHGGAIDPASSSPRRPMIVRTPWAASHCASVLGQQSSGLSV